MRADGFLRFLFIVYCAEAGAVLCAAPWGVTWSRLIAMLPWVELQGLVASSWVRAAVTGSGLVHLLYALHDIDQWARRPRPDPAADEPEYQAPAGTP